MQPLSSLRLVLFHGLASSPREFGMLVHPLRRAGVSLLAPEVDGYSFSSLASPAKWGDWVAAAAAQIDAIAAESPEPFVLGGLCTGAMLAIAVAAHRPQPKLRGLALLSPLFAYDGWGLPWWYGLRRIAYALGIEQRFAMTEREPFGLKNDRMRGLVRQQFESDQTTIIGPASVSLQVVRESERLSRHARSALRKLTHPMVVMHAREDEICKLASVTEALSRSASRSLSTHVLENSFHMISADNDRQEVALRLAGFVATGSSRLSADADIQLVHKTDRKRRKAALQLTHEHH